MVCPHCRVAFHSSRKKLYQTKDAYDGWAIFEDNCPECKRIIFTLGRGVPAMAGGGLVGVNVIEEIMAWPKGASRTPCPADVPQKFAEDYKEACLVLNDSAKASAALSRRCLQNLLREAAGVKHGNLADEIQEVLDSRKLPTHLSQSIDAVRNIGNFAAHPMKSQKSGEILDVEPGEAEWNLDVLEAFFDFYFVQPAVIAKKKQDLNKKLGDAGKPPMK